MATTAQSSTASGKKRKSPSYNQDEEAQHLEVPFHDDNPATPSTRKYATDAEEGEATEFFTPHTSKRHLTTTTPSAAHIRFDSISPPPSPSAVAAHRALETISAEAARRKTAEDDLDDNDDAAPEEITLFAAQTQSHVQRAQAAGAALAQGLAQKRKRRRKDAKLKAQAASSGRKQKEEKGADEAKEGAIITENETTEETPEGQEQISLDNLPAILPESILLAADQASSAPSAAAEALHKRGSRLNARRRAAIRIAAYDPIRVPNTKPLKAVRRGPVSVRVLEAQSSLLPPKTEFAARSIRETWLKGRQGMAQRQVSAKKGKAKDEKGVGRMERRVFGVKGQVRPFV